MQKLIFLSTFLAVSAEAKQQAPDQEQPIPPCEENGDERPRCLFEFDENGQVHTKDKQAERTFSFPAVKAGMLVDVHDLDVLPYISLRAFRWTWGNQDFALDAGATLHRLFVDVHYEFIPIIAIGPTIWAGWNFEGKNTWAAGVGFGLLKF